MNRTIILSLLALTAAACAPVQRGIVPINTVGVAHEEVVWVYIETSDESVNGVYECYEDSQGRPVCKKAALQR